MEESRSNELGPRSGDQLSRSLSPAPLSTVALTTKVAVSALVWLSFWTAVALPIAYFYLLYKGLTVGELWLLGKLLGVHVLAFVVGRGYNVGGRAGASVGAVRNQDRSA